MTNYWLAALAVLFLGLGLQYLAFERKRPAAGEIVLLAILIALAIISRLAFAWLPHMKPMLGICMIAGAVLGPLSGFFVGSTAVLLSNFFFGHGPWTPWQMFAFGLGAMLYALIYKFCLGQSHRLVQGLLAALLVLVLVGPILDISAMLLSVRQVSYQALVSFLLSGLPINVLHALATFLTVSLFGPAMIKNIERVKVKYGLA